MQSDPYSKILVVYYGPNEATTEDKYDIVIKGEWEYTQVYIPYNFTLGEE